MNAALWIVGIGIVLWLLARVLGRPPALGNRFDTHLVPAPDPFEATARKPQPSIPPSVPHRLTDKGTWIPPGNAVRVRQFEIPNAMIYVGADLPSVRGGYAGADPCLVDPTLSVASPETDRDGSRMGYWSSYEHIDPACRASYLQWLARGRPADGTDVGYAFLFFYGLERRLLVDGQRDPVVVAAEAPALLAEVERLRGIFTESHSFQRYAASLCQFISLISGDMSNANELPSMDSPPEPGDAWSVDVAVGSLVAEGRPVPADWALQWWATDYDTRLRTPARRCWPLFVALFRLRYAAHFGSGIAPKRPKSTLACSYQPASASFGGPIEVAFPELPNIRKLRSAYRKLDAFAESCTSELDAYSRWLARSTDVDSPLPGLALLPAELLQHHRPAELGPLTEWLSDALRGASSALVEVSPLLRLWPCRRSDRFSKPEAVALAQLSEHLGYGLEPDVRFGGGAWKQGGRLVLFRLSDEHIAAPTEKYASATTLLHLAALVARADGVVDDAADRALERQIEGSMHLHEAERLRLRAHLEWLMAEQPGLAGLKKRLAQLHDAERAALCDLAVGIAGADGHIHPKEVAVLEKIYQLVGRQAQDLYADLHSVSMPPESAPVLVQPATPGRPGHAIPPRPERDAQGGGFELDPGLVQARLAESLEVSHLLADIFEDDEPNPRASPPERDARERTSTVARLPGLGDIESQFVRGLAGRDRLSRIEFERLAGELGLMPEGLFEAVNDAAFDVADAPLLEGDDPIEVDRSVWEAMTA